MSYHNQYAQQTPNPYSQQNPNPMPPRTDPVAPESIQYICGDCGVKSSIQGAEPIKCKECGHRVMYKPRTHRIVCY